MGLLIFNRKDMYKQEFYLQERTYETSTTPESEVFFIATNQLTIIYHNSQTEVRECLLSFGVESFVF
jgi:hypothetical protein